ncbi:hypothetical protein C1Y63_05655 [Corynebacterium sp. 13CS0277]|uniref:hypothetical protein n=1 Tax=Corynebacterium sp. 13CS0277 TaxID=2071994 RepID=UPI000D04364B|nr:hypothetical protein [Corynebacterium sp. 13CS0277]PRQ11489.1 hypothetical protein C1Y63_05655 [Corynebacterium sp. 13CS0277]
MTPQRTAGVLGLAAGVLALVLLSLPAAWMPPYPDLLWGAPGSPGMAWHPTCGVCVALIAGVMAAALLAPRWRWWWGPAAGGGLLVVVLVMLWVGGWEVPPLAVRALGAAGLLAQVLPAGMVLRDRVLARGAHQVTWRQLAGSVVCVAVTWPLVPVVVALSAGGRTWASWDAVVISAGGWVVAWLVVVWVWPRLRRSPWPLQGAAIIMIPVAGVIDRLWVPHTADSAPAIASLILLRGVLAGWAFCGAGVLARAARTASAALRTGPDVTARVLAIVGAFALGVPWTINCMLIAFGIPLSFTHPPSASVLSLKAAPLPSLLTGNPDVTIWELSANSLWASAYLLGGPLLVGWGVVVLLRSLWARISTKDDGALWGVVLWVMAVVSVAAVLAFATNPTSEELLPRRLFATGAVCCAAVLLTRHRAAPVVAPWLVAVLALPDAPNPAVLAGSAAMASAAILAATLWTTRSAPAPGNQGRARRAGAELS